MTARRPQPKVVRLIYPDAKYTGPGFLIEADPPIWAEEIGPAGTDAAILDLARGSVEFHTAAWLLYFTTGQLTLPYKPASVVVVLGLDQSTHYTRKRVWQAEGMALIEAAKLSETVADAASIVVTDYRVEGARVMRQTSAACERARRWCDAYERKQKAQGRYDRPPLGMPLPGRPAVEAAIEVTAHTDPDQEALRFYRESMVSGEVSG